MLNSVNLIGRTTSDIDWQEIGGQTGQDVANFRIAVDRGRKDANGNRTVDYIPVRYWRQGLARFADLVGKGSLISISGELRLDQWTGQDGQQRNRLYVLARSVGFINLKPAATQAQSAYSQTPQYDQPQPQQSQPAPQAVQPQQQAQPVQPQQQAEPAPQTYNPLAGITANGYDVGGDNFEF